jgi:UDP-N-acetylglucosamine 2-epimerase (non-hydrolysing)
MTTVLGAIIGRSLRVPVAHIEGGLRSYDFRNPFPEEVNRRLATSLARVHYAPGAWAAGNLGDRDVVDTGSNTIRDALALVPDAESPFTHPSPPYGVVSLHRYELLNNAPLLKETLTTLAASARQVPLVFVDHSVTRAAIARQRLDGVFDGERFVRIDRLRFFDYIRAERRSAFVITDSGGSQEECYYLDLPCLVHRARTERREGLGENALLSQLRTDVLREFLAEPSRYRRRTQPPNASPSDVIVADLERRGFAA